MVPLRNCWKSGKFHMHLHIYQIGTKVEAYIICATADLEYSMQCKSTLSRDINLRGVNTTATAGITTNPEQRNETAL